MKTTRKLDSGKYWHIEYPDFDRSTKQGAEVNDYFEKLISLIKEYCKSGILPEFTKYYVSYNIDEENGKILIKIILSLRKRGHFIKKKQLSVLWNGTYIEKQTVSDIIRARPATRN